MPKGKKTSSKQLNEGAKSSAVTECHVQSAVTMSKDGNIVISVQAKPGAKHNNITGNFRIRVDMCLGVKDPWMEVGAS
jgi:hypothetical protein